MAFNNPLLDFTVDNLVSDVQRRFSGPLTPSLFQQVDFISFLDSELRSDLTLFIRSAREEYFETVYTTPIIQNVVTYAIPYRAIGMTTRKVNLLDPNNNLLELVQLSLEDIQLNYVPYSSPFFPNGYYVQNNNVILFPPNLGLNNSYKLQIVYERRPNSLVSSSVCGQVQSFNATANTAVLTNVPTNWVVGMTFDFYNGYPPFDSVGDDVQLTNISGSTLTFSALPTNIAINQWVSPSMQGCIAQIPYDAYPLLNQLATMKCVEALGDTAGLQNAEKKYEQMKVNYKSLQPRMEGEDKILNNKNTVFGVGRGNMGNYPNAY